MNKMIGILLVVMLIVCSLYYAYKGNNQLSPTYEIITATGNKIEYYIM